MIPNTTMLVLMCGARCGLTETVTGTEEGFDCETAPPTPLRFVACGYALVA